MKILRPVVVLALVPPLVLLTTALPRRWTPARLARGPLLRLDAEVRERARG